MKQYLIPILTALTLGCTAANPVIKSQTFQSIDLKIYEGLKQNTYYDIIFIGEVCSEKNSTNNCVKYEMLVRGYENFKTEIFTKEWPIFGINLDSICGVDSNKKRIKLMTNSAEVISLNYFIKEADDKDNFSKQLLVDALKQRAKMNGNKCEQYLKIINENKM